MLLLAVENRTAPSMHMPEDEVANKSTGYSLTYIIFGIFFMLGVLRGLYSNLSRRCTGNVTAVFGELIKIKV